MRSFFILCFLPWFSLLSYGQAKIDSLPTGTASYYAAKFEGRKTANGEILDNKKMTAAHKKLPFGTLVKVTNLSNDSSVVVRINDRLPQNSKRTIDLTKAAAAQLNFIQKGITKVTLEMIEQEEKVN
jgi:rare lipoprotein A